MHEVFPPITALVSLILPCLLASGSFPATAAEVGQGQNGDHEAMAAWIAEHTGGRRAACSLAEIRAALNDHPGWRDEIRRQLDEGKISIGYGGLFGPLPGGVSAECRRRDLIYGSGWLAAHLSMDRPVAGEGLMSAGNTLPGAFRYLHAEAESAVRDAEILATMAALQGAAYPSPAIDLAWRQLLFAASSANTDDPHERDAVNYAYREAFETAQAVVEAATGFLASNVRCNHDRVLVLFNSTAQPLTPPATPFVGACGYQCVDQPPTTEPVTFQADADKPGEFKGGFGGWMFRTADDGNGATLRVFSGVHREPRSSYSLTLRDRRDGGKHGQTRWRLLAGGDGLAWGDCRISARANGGDSVAWVDIEALVHGDRGGVELLLQPAQVGPVDRPVEVVERGLGGWAWMPGGGEIAPLAVMSRSHSFRAVNEGGAIAIALEQGINRFRLQPVEQGEVQDAWRAFAYEPRVTTKPEPESTNEGGRPWPPSGSFLQVDRSDVELLTITPASNAEALFLVPGRFAPPVPVDRVVVRLGNRRADKVTARLRSLHRAGPAFLAIRYNEQVGKALPIRDGMIEVELPPSGEVGVVFEVRPRIPERGAVDLPIKLKDVSPGWTGMAGWFGESWPGNGILTVRPERLRWTLPSSGEGPSGGAAIPLIVEQWGGPAVLEVELTAPPVPGVQCRVEPSRVRVPPGGSAEAVLNVLPSTGEGPRGLLEVPVVARCRFPWAVVASVLLESGEDVSVGDPPVDIEVTPTESGGFRAVIRNKAAGPLIGEVAVLVGAEAWQDVAHWRTRVTIPSGGTWTTGVAEWENRPEVVVAWRGSAGRVRAVLPADNVVR